MTDRDNDRYRRAFVLVLLAAVGAAFVTMVRDFLIAVLMAAIFSALLYPVYRRVLALFRGRAPLASVTVVLLAVIAVGLPLLAFVGVVAAEAVQVTRTVAPWIREQLEAQMAAGASLPPWLPFAEEIEPYRSRILSKLGEVVGTAGQFFAGRVSAVTQGTVKFLLNLFIMLYAMFFFLMRGPELLDALMSYVPLGEADRRVILERGMSVTRATLKGILVIGLLQGALVGLALWAAGIEGAAFWGTVTVVLSAVPGLGAPLIWGPAAIYLVTTGAAVSGAALAAWGVLVVGAVDNVLRPRIVGGDTKLPDLLILLSTLGGIAMFGALGILLGPILAAVTVTVLDIYRTVFVEEAGHGETRSTGP